MHTRLFSGFCIAAIAFALIPSQRDEAPLAPAESVAFSTLYPAFVPNDMPLPEMVDMAIESKLQPHETSAAPDHRANITARLDSSQQEPNKPYLTALPARGSTLRVATTHDNLQNFSAILRPDGFQRPQWQDMDITANLGAHDTSVEPFVVMIDPGHGGTDQGAAGHNGLLEKNLTLDIAKRVRLFLTEFEHIDVRLTRHHDYGLSRQARVDAIQRSEADLVISLHFNHLPQSDVNLVETFYAGPANIAQSLTLQSVPQRSKLQRTSSTPGIDLSFTEGSARLAKALQQRIFNEVNFSDESAQNAGVKQETLFVLTRSFTPGVLLEISCLSHAHEADRLESDEYRNRLAAALVDGIRDYHDALQDEPLHKQGDLGA